MLSIAIQHHPKRAEMLHRLLTQLDCDPKIVTDSTGAGLWPTCRRAWQSYSSDATHHLVLHDDVEVCRDFIPAAFNAIEARPDQPLSFFCTRKKATEAARASGKSWVSAKHPLMSQAFCLPVPMIEPMLNWIEANISPAMPLGWDDVRIALYCEQNGIRMFYTVPSLVEHVGGRESLWTKCANPRMAAEFIGNGDPLTIKWTTDVVMDNSGTWTAYKEFLPNQTQTIGTTKHLDDGMETMNAKAERSS